MNSGFRYPDSRSWCWVLRCLAVVGFLCCCCRMPVLAQDDEAAVRAAFVFNLTKYVDWPGSKNELVIGFLGEGTMGDALEKLVGGKNSGSRLIRIVQSPTDEEAEKCDILYVAYSSPKKAKLALLRLHSKNILTVGESDEFVREGGMVGLVRDGDHIQIEVNLDSVQAGGLKISSQLLNLAQIVRAGKRG